MIISLKWKQKFIATLECIDICVLYFPSLNTLTLIWNDFHPLSRCMFIKKHTNTSKRVGYERNVGNERTSHRNDSISEHGTTKREIEVGRRKSAGINSIETAVQKGNECIPFFAHTERVRDRHAPLIMTRTNTLCSILFG